MSTGGETGRYGGLWTLVGAPFGRFCLHAAAPGDDAETRHIKEVFACYELVGLPFVLLSTVSYWRGGFLGASVANTCYLLFTVGLLAALWLRAPVRPLYHFACIGLMINTNAISVLLGGNTSSGYASIWSVLAPVALIINGLPGGGFYMAAFVAIEIVFHLLEPFIRAHVGIIPTAASNYYLFLNTVGVVILLYVPIAYLNRRRIELKLKVDEEHRHRVEDAERVAKTDHLTGLPNRSCFERDWIPKIESQGACVFVALDLDHFKWVNDLHGHDAGDKALIKTAKIGSEVFRDGLGNLFRFGGEEFVAVLFGGMEEALRRAALFCERMESRAASELAAEGLRLKRPGPDGSLEDRTLTASVGVAAWSREVLGLREAIKLADEACYRAKQFGRNRVERAG